MSLILCCCFFIRFQLFFGIFVKCFWQFGYVKFHSLCDFKHAIIKLSAYPSTYGLLIEWFIFCCRVNFYGSSLRQCFKCGMRYIVLCCLPLQATTCKGMLNVAKIQYKLRIASGLNLPWYKSMECNMEENFSMEWKIASMEKSSSIPYHALLFVHSPSPLIWCSFMWKHQPNLSYQASTPSK